MALISKTDALAVARFSKDPAEGIENLPAIDLVHCEECAIREHCKVRPLMGEEGYCSRGESENEPGSKS